jgi:hypothetical protein
MIETLPTPAIDLDFMSPEIFTHWEKDPDPIIAETHQAFLRQNKKSARPLEELDPISSASKEGIYTLRRFDGYTLLQVGQRRGVKDLFTRGRSAHDIAFGVAQIRNGGGPRLVNVAIKHFYESGKAVIDAANNSAILDRGFSTTNPMAVIIDNARGYIITPVIPGVQSIDTEPWHQYLNNPDSEVAEHFEGRLKDIAEMAAKLNSKGINHADGALRNYWVTTTGKVEPFDWESANLTSNSPTPNDLIRFGVGTLRPLYKSLETPNDSDRDRDRDRVQTVAILKGHPENRWNQFNGLVFQHYIDQLIEDFNNKDLLNDEYLEAIASIEVALREKLKTSSD